MRFSVSDVELRRMVDLGQPTFEQPRPGHSFDHELLSRLAVAFDCESVTFQVSRPAHETHEELLEGLQNGRTTNGDPLVEEDERRAYWAAHWEDAFCCHPELSGDHVSVTMGSDFRSEDAYRSSVMGELCEGMACLMVPLPWSEGRDRRLLFWRVAGGHFDESDRLLLTLLRPHLAQVLEAHDRAAQDPPRLTPRERELVTLLAGGLTNRQIGRELGIAEGTVRKHLEHVYARLGVTNRVAALAAYPDLNRPQLEPYVFPELARVG
jgi:DNA-binding CsgD family transcriptional regulator